MQLRRSLGLICAESILLLSAGGVTANTLTISDEPEMQRLSASMDNYSVNSTTVLTPPISTPLLCGNTSAAASNFTAISPIYSPTGNTQAPFVFGAAFNAPTKSAIAYGPTITGYTGPTMDLAQDPALVCYGLDQFGVHGPTAGVMRDQFEGTNFSPTFKASFNSSIVLTVVHRPTSPTDAFVYTIDVTIPAKPAGCVTGVDCNFALLEGFDSSVFSTNAGGWCLANAGAQSCPGTPKLGGIYINYTNFADSQVDLAAGVATKAYHFVVQRYFASGVSTLPQTDKPVVLTALFSPFDMDENFIGDNVAAGYTNSAPTIVQDTAWTTFSSSLSALSENTNSGTLSFNITDVDTPGAMTATMTLNLGSLVVPVTPTCVAGSGSGAANSQCSISLNLASANWWDDSVSSVYKGLGNAFATDPGGVNASATIIASDASGKKSVAANVPIHVQSSANNAPVLTYALPSVADSFQGGALIPTYSCSIAANNCGGLRSVVDVPGAASAAPGPAAALDELAMQSVAVVSYTGGDANGGNVQCANEQGTIFAANGAPIALPSAGSLALNFQLSAPLTAGSALCTLKVTDSAVSFPVGQSAQTTSKPFRVVVAQ